RLQEQKQLDFPRGYHIELLANRTMPDMFFGNITDFCDIPFGPGLREEMRRKYGTMALMAGRGEMIANEHSFCELDPSVKDRFGIPVLRFHWKWGDNEIKQASRMGKTFVEFFKRAGGKILYGGATDGEKAISAGGEIIHEVGTTRMGTSAADSVTDGFGRTWDVDNLVVVDGGVFTSNAHKNPTLTIMALAWRSMDHLADRMRKNEI
ncbi:MAG TPA: GMC family oxidoreductase, partial [Rhizomicrobium sp.]|nr:GMC family oxidoreductase [Rhizomicrobium sp.]